MILVFFGSCSESNSSDRNSSDTNQEKYSDYQKSVLRFRDSASTMFLSGANGVLLKEDLSTTGSFHYFDPSESYRIGAELEVIEDGEVIEMKTNTERLPEYRRYGLLKFNVGTEACQLTLYQNVEQPSYFFCPFKDMTNGKETYGAGRYLDFEFEDLKNPVIDFNLCYNPYCAYNYNYSCPIPPIENHLKIAIEAGEKKWK